MNGVPSGAARVANAFSRAAAAGRGALIPYLCAGDPERTTSALVLRAAAAGADLIELGIPYGDPLADGPTVAAAAQRSLEAGTTIEDALALGAEVAHEGAPPILAFTYFNPILQFGLERFAEALVTAGMCGAIVPDVPLEETPPIRAAFEPRGLVLPLLIAPTTPAARAVEIAEASSGFVYIVSRLGVTSARTEPDFGWIGERVAALRARTAAPLAIGFGISTPEHVRAACRIADAAIVGSALIDAFAGLHGSEASGRVGSFIADLRRATTRSG